MKAFEVIDEILNDVAEAALTHPEDNGNVGALIDRLRRDVKALPAWANIEIDDDEEDDDTGVDVEDLGHVTYTDPVEQTAKSHNPAALEESAAAKPVKYKDVSTDEESKAGSKVKGSASK